MTDLRKLAKKQFAAVYSLLNFDLVPPTLVLEYRKSCIEVFERILREHHEGLAEEIVRVLRSFDYVDHVEDEAAMFGEILRVLEGGGQGETGEGETTAEPTLGPAAPDQPHEFVPTRVREMTPGPIKELDRCSCHVWRGFDDGIGECNRSASDPIHQTNEVSDARINDQRVLPGPDSRVLSVEDHPPQVTNYDAEAEAKARKKEHRLMPVEMAGVRLSTLIDLKGLAAKGGLTLHEVVEDRLSVLRKAGARYDEALSRIAELERELAEAKADAKANDEAHQTALRVLDQNKRDFKEMTLTANAAIRERDEARAERDRARVELRAVQAHVNCVRLDDATIERVFHEINQGAGTLYDDVIRVLRSLRDGKLKEASDDDA